MHNEIDSITIVRISVKMKSLSVWTNAGIVSNGISPAVKFFFVTDQIGRTNWSDMEASNTFGGVGAQTFLNTDDRNLLLYINDSFYVRR